MYIEEHQLIVINNDGEVVDTIEPGDRILRKKSIDSYNETIAWGKGMRFIKVFDVFNDVALEISGAAYGIACRLGMYIQYGSNLVYNKVTKNPMNNDDISELTGYSKPTVAKLMDELVEHKVFFRGRTGKSYQYYANPYIFCRGNKINRTLEAMFKSYK